ncbi:Spore maturation protein CgeB [Methylobacillus rhizosphaerae]|uniref:Spore maturation protein CgeB n=1 Tax=Methylobacillus rhizosphaerae TaxID=551994 RepID=A0A238XM80_9PROT|nr:glycosyltransferase [Methylobacillus rhizosphaerae]SNR59563.1 Spore maturation protein CgeB [Methylobacillus rhizosphaerae]
MVGRVIRKLGSLVYKYPAVLEDTEQTGPFGTLKIAVVVDYFTAACLSSEARIRVMTPSNYKEVITQWKPDLVFVESAFHGTDGSWRYELAKQPRLLRLTKPTAIFRLVEFAKSQGIPTVFWNKDDGPFFDAFIEVAKVFDYVFTTDEECVAKYKEQVPTHVPVNTLLMPFQPAYHSFTGFNFTHNEACFTGSYYKRILNERRRFLDMVFDSCEATGMTLNVFDRNHDRLSRYFEFSFPTNSQIRMHGKVPHRETADIYKRYLVSLNVNSVTNSDTMYSRRLLEILACGGIVVTNPSRAVDRHFREFCHVVDSAEETRELFARLRQGPSPSDLERAAAGAAHVRQHYTWTQRLQDICAITGI